MLDKLRLGIQSFRDGLRAGRAWRRLAVFFLRATFFLTFIEHLAGRPAFYATPQPRLTRSREEIGMAVNVARAAHLMSAATLFGAC